MPNFYLDSVTICCQIILTVTLLVWILFIIHYTRQKSKKDFFHTYSRTEWKKKMTEHKALEIRSKLPVEQKQASFFKFKKT